MQMIPLTTEGEEVAMVPLNRTAEHRYLAGDGCLVKGEQAVLFTVHGLLRLTLLVGQKGSQRVFRHITHVPEPYFRLGRKCNTEVNSSRYM